MRPLIALLAFAAVPAYAQQQQCGPRDAGLAHLEQKYGETRIGAGLDQRGMVVEVLTNPVTGSWTIIMSGPDGQACIVAAGESWEIYAPRPTGTPG